MNSLREHLKRKIDMVDEKYLVLLYKIIAQFPLDRLMIAQAIHNDLTIITKDRAFSQYDIKMEWAIATP